MKCFKCGKVSSDKGLFCKACGGLMVDQEGENQEDNVSANKTVLMDQSAYVPNAEHINSIPWNAEPNKDFQKPNDKKSAIKYIGIAIGAVLIVLVLLAGFLLIKPRMNLVTRIDPDAFVLQYPDDTALVFQNYKGESVNVEVDTDSDTSNMTSDRIVKYSFDRKTIAILINNIGYNLGGDLICIRGQKKYSIASDVSIASISDDGSFIAYIQITSDTEGDLYRYNTNTNKKEKIKENVFPLFFTQSPNGKQVGYITDFDSSNSTFKGYFQIDGEELELGKNKMPLMITDNGKLQYTAKYDSSNDSSTVYVVKGEEENKLASDLNNVSISMNRDCSEILFVDAEKTYISASGGEKQRLFTRPTGDIVLPLNVSIAWTTIGNLNISRYDIDTFKEKVFYSSGELQYVLKDWTTERITSKVDQYMLSADYKSLIYSDTNSSLHQVKNLGKSREAIKISDDYDVISFAASANMKHIYFIDTDDDLRYIKNEKTSERIAYDVMQATMDPLTGQLYFIADYSDGSGKVYSSRNGGKKVALEKASDVARIITKYAGVCYWEETEGDITLYYGQGGKAFKKIAEMSDIAGVYLQ